MTALPRLAPLDMSVLSGDGIILRGTLRYPESASSTKPPLAVLAHQYPATRDSYAPLVEDLLALGFATLAFDERGHGKSIWRTSGEAVTIDAPYGFGGEPFGTAFVSSVGKVAFGEIADDIVRVAGWGTSQNFVDASRVLLVGASVGGAGSVFAAPRVTPLKGLLTFGAAGVPAFGQDAGERARSAVASLSCPCLFASAEGDAYAGADNARAWSEAGRDATLVLVPGDAHAMAIYYDVRDRVLAFLKRVLQ
jgi:pimeloyl-ACP methyl ester carboxylesterase